MSAPQAFGHRPRRPAPGVALAALLTAAALLGRAPAWGQARPAPPAPPAATAAPAPASPPTAAPLPSAPPALQPDTGGDPTQARRDQLQQVQQEKSQLMQRLDSFKLSEQEALQEIEQLRQDVRTARQRLQDLQSLLARVTQEQAQRQDKLAALQLRMAAGQARLNLRLRRLYRLAKVDDSATLLDLARSRTFARDATLLVHLQRQDVAALHQFEALRQELAAQQALAQDSLERLQGVRDQADQERQELQQRSQRLHDSLREMRRNQRLYARYLADLDTVQAGMQQALVALEKQRSAQRQEQADPGALRGRLPPPVAGTVVLRFGQQDPHLALKRFQRGLIIRTAQDSPVLAVAAGSVVYAGPFRGYEDLVVLDHGKGLYTVYGHLQRLTVKQGDWVEAGKSVGQVTPEPDDGSNDLYFEVRLDGKPDDPLHWLQGGKLKQGATPSGGG